MSKRIYAQLQPDPDGLNHLLALQSEVPGRGRKINLKRLHLTLIHFGIIDEIITQLPCDQVAAEQAVRIYIAESKAVLGGYPQQIFEVRPLGFELFGEYARTLVVRYESTPALIELHGQLLAVLKRFFRSCGVQDVAAYMRSDMNFRHALTITPHITIAKGYTGNLPLARQLRPIRLTIMPFEYDE